MVFGISLNTFLNPLQDAAEKLKGVPVLGTIGNILSKTDTAVKAVGAALLAAPIIGASYASGGIVARAVSALPSLVPKTTAGKVAAVVATPIVFGAVKENPVKAVSTVVKTGTGLVNVGSNLEKLGENPTLENAKSLFTENPVITSSLAAGGLVLGGGGIGLAANTVATYVNSRATKSNTEATLGGENASGLLGSSNEVLATGTSGTSGEAALINTENPVTASSGTQTGMPTEVVGVKKSSKKRKSKVKIQATTTRIVNQNFINIKNNQKGWSN